MNTVNKQLAASLLRWIGISFALFVVLVVLNVSTSPTSEYQDGLIRIHHKPECSMRRTGSGFIQCTTTIWVKDVEPFTHGEKVFAIVIDSDDKYKEPKRGGIVTETLRAIGVLNKPSN